MSTLRFLLILNAHRTIAKRHSFNTYIHNSSPTQPPVSSQYSNTQSIPNENVFPQQKSPFMVRDRWAEVSQLLQSPPLVDPNH